jgi:hypothetical protein
MNQPVSDKVTTDVALGRVSHYCDVQLTRLLANVIDAVTRYQRNDIDVRAVNCEIERYGEAASQLSEWANRGSVDDRVAFIDRPEAATFDWWNLPERERERRLNAGIAEKESREREGRRVRWPWSKSQRNAQNG